jgi:CubicO group peptidase (beta-lactamase class C family)
MRNMRKSLLIVIVALFITPITQAQIDTRQLDAYITALHNDKEFNGTILVGQQGKIVYKKAFGYADYSNQIENSDSSLFNLASISKTLTAIAVLQLKDKGKLRLDDSYSKYFKDFPYPKITVKHLLSHTSGIPDTEPLFDSLISKNTDRIFSNSDIIPALILYSKSKPLRFETGERWGYSNAGYGLLALLIEKLSKQPFAVYMKRNVFAPAGMKHTYVQTSLSQKRDKNRVNNYSYANHFTMKLELVDTLAYLRGLTYNLTGITGSTNVISNVQDLWEYDKALHEGKLIKLPSLEEAFTPVKLNNGKDNVAVEGSYGLGWFIKTDSAGNKLVFHSGAGPGILTFFVRNLTKNQTLIILQNIQNSMFDINPIAGLIINKPARYKKSAGFAYARDLFEKGSDYAMVRLIVNKNDTMHYGLTEKDMSRAGLEFGRNRSYQLYSLEAYRINTLLFPDSWKVFDDYAGALSRNGKMEEAELMYRQSLSINAGNQNAASFLKALSDKKIEAKPER